MNVHSSFFIISPDWKQLKCPPGSGRTVMKQNRRQGQEAALTGPAGVEPRPPGRSLGSWGGAKGTGAEPRPPGVKADCRTSGQAR